VPEFVDFDYLSPCMQELILDYLGHHGEVTFIELEDDVPGFAGELTFKAADNRNTILWRGLSHSAVHALSELARRGQVRFTKTSCGTYQSMGRRLQLPVGRWDCPSLHWTPVLVDLTKH
jgi:hypothetical protein